MMGDPIGVNPCSLDAIKEVLLQLKQTAIAHDRHWTIIGCDGLPYHLASKVIDANEELHDILLQPGLGHYEINLTKAFIKLTWDVVGEDLAKMLGFRTPKALNACKQANDHHKAWQMIEILLYGLGDELLLPYVRTCLDSGTEPSADGFFSWSQDAVNPNYRFLLECIFTYGVALHYFRAGVRRNNSRVMLASRMKLSPLFYGLHKINYQRIDFLDLKSRVLAPPEIANYINDHESFTVSGHPSKGEGCDFILEANNRASKMWLPPGSPSQDHWLRVCRNLDRLKKIEIDFNQTLGVKESKDSIYHCNSNVEITEWRKHIRESEYLLAPCQARNHQSLSGIALDADLADFSAKCKGNRLSYLAEIEAYKFDGIEYYVKIDGIEYYVKVGGIEYYVKIDGIEYYVKVGGIEYYAKVDEIEYYVKIDGIEYYVKVDGIEYYVKIDGNRILREG
ncbi:uncharacterized protein [Argopecten irradians]|uniref:uncharacterized protein n=1 Tax=Argopecten irradians TaxID=31199 RepID=UPI0037245156